MSLYPWANFFRKNIPAAIIIYMEYFTRNVLYPKCFAENVLTKNFARNMLHPETSHLWQMIDVQALGVKLLQRDMCRVQPVHLKSHQLNTSPQSELMPQVKISPGDRTLPGPGCPSTASPVPQPRCSSTWSARNPLSGLLTRSPSGRRSAPEQTPCWLFTMKVEIYQYIYNI